MSEFLIGLVGDIVVDRDLPGEPFDEVRAVLATPDILFANLECAYTDSPEPADGAPSVLSSPAHNLEGVIELGLDVVSLANNHMLDVGAAAMAETRARLRRTGTATAGAGLSIADAHRPGTVEAGEIRVAFLAYTSIYPEGHEAGADRPGLAVVRAANQYHAPYARYNAPGMLPMVTTVTSEADLARLASDIAAARQSADLVVASFHWGDQTCPYYLTDHEKRTARFAIDHGADMVVGHHHHALRGMEWYDGKPILYGLGHFVFDFRMEASDAAIRQFADSPIGRHYRRINYSAGPRVGWPLLPFPDDGRMTAIAFAWGAATGITRIGFLPCTILANGTVRPLRAGTPECVAIVDYLKTANRSQDLAGRISLAPIEVAGFPVYAVEPAG